jgi:hypothetical protein
MSATESIYSTVLANVLATTLTTLDRRLAELLREDIEKIVEAVFCFLGQPISPATFLQFERRLQQILREVGRKVMEFTCNECDPESPEDLPHDARYEGAGYRRINSKTPNRYVDTTFGRMTLWRRGYRYWHRDPKEPTIFPVELILGLVHGATPALADEIGRMMAESGATQNRVLQHARRQFGVSFSIERLRDLVDALAESMERFRQHYQVKKLLELLKQAKASRGRYKPSLSVGRDGICMPIAHGGGYQQGAVATITVYDGRGRRVGTVYLSSPPESGQPTLTEQLTGLIKECLFKWCSEQGEQLPRLCYATDAGDTECQYYRNVLCRLRDPRNSRKYLHWHRTIDYFHATEKITIMAEALFGSGRKASSWARKMRKLLSKPSGVSRVLHSAAAMESIYGVKANRQDDFNRAYNYIRSRARYMKYAELKKMKLPIGSGVTEAACKNIFTQRLKLSGMGWKHPGARVILTLRVIVLSGIWDDVYQASVNERNPIDLKPYNKHDHNTSRIAA